MLGIPLRQHSYPPDTAGDGLETTRRGQLPNFLIIGAAKSGTTSLWQYLRQHPQVFMHPMKRLHFFSYGGDPRFNGPAPQTIHCRLASDIDAYAEQFHQGAGKLAIGECSNSYLYYPTAAERIHYYLPDVKLVAILRHPAERAYSRYLMLVQAGRESELDFRVALEMEEKRIHEGWWPEFHYLRAGMYYSQLLPYLERFDKDRLKIILNEDLVVDPIGTMRSLFEFLGVDSTFTPDVSTRYSVTGLPRSRLVHSVASGLRTLRPHATRYLSDSQLRRISSVAALVNRRNAVKPPLAGDVRNWLIDRYREDSSELQRLIKRDLSAWLC